MEAVQSKTLVEAAFRRLRTDILRGKLTPGEKLPVEQLSKGYSVGTTPLREALSRLTAAGLVTAEGQRGFRVAPVSPENLIDLSRTRIWIEGLALRAAIARGDRRWEADIVAAAYRLRGLKPFDAQGVTESWDRENHLFHDALIAACGSPQLLAYREHLQDMSDRYRRLAVLDGLAGRDLDAEHDAIMEAALARDANRAIKRLADHLLQTTQVVLAMYVAGPGEAKAIVERLRREIDEGLGV